MASSGPHRGRARYRRILRFAAWHLARTWWFELALPRLGLGRITERTRTRRMVTVARSFRALAVELGGLMIKVGQFLSSRLDVLPPELTSELEGLQDEVPPVAFPAIQSLAENEFGAPLGRVFARFDEVPVAAASLGQAHRGELLGLDGAEVGFRDVVVKVQRPGIGHIVDIDLAALRRVGGWLSRFRFVARRVDMPAMVEEFARSSLEEIDYLNEAAYADRFATEFDRDARVRVPAVVWERTTRRVLTLEDVSAIKITDTQGLREAGIDPVVVAPVFAEVMFQQLFRNGFFHADPHPGNIFVTPVGENGRDSVKVSADAPGSADGGRPWTLTFVDFGMMGQVTAGTRSGLRKLLIAAAARDGKGLVAAIREIGVLVPSADAVELESVMTELFARFGGMGFAELREVDQREFRDFAVQFGDVMRSTPFQLPENFLLIIRAMSLTSGVCSALDPKFNLWESIEPFAAQLLRDERGNVVQDAGRQLLSVASSTVGLPKRLDAMLDRVDHGTLSVSVPKLERRLVRVEKLVRRLGYFTVFAAALVTGAIIRTDAVVLGNVLMALSLLPLLHGLWVGRR